MLLSNGIVKARGNLTGCELFHDRLPPTSYHAVRALEVVLSFIILQYPWLVSGHCRLVGLNLLSLLA